jgi:hypothetical protein
MLAAFFRLAPFLAEEEAGPSCWTSAASASFLSERDARHSQNDHRRYDHNRAPHVDLLITCDLFLATCYLPIICAVDRSFSAQMNSISSPPGTIF